MTKNSYLNQGKSFFILIIEQPTSITGKEINANALSFPIEKKMDFRDGISKEVDIFEVQASLLPLYCKLANINDKESTFSDLEAYDQLTIKLAEH